MPKHTTTKSHRRTRSGSKTRPASAKGATTKKPTTLGLNRSVLERINGTEPKSRGYLLSVILEQFVASADCNPLFIARIPKPRGLIKDEVVPVTLWILPTKMLLYQEVSDKVAGGSVSRLMQAAAHKYFPPTTSGQGLTA